MNGQLTHVVRSDFSVNGRTVYGYAVPFAVEATVNDGWGQYLESFDRGAFRNVVRGFDRVRFRYLHGPDEDVIGWIGKTQLLREENAGLYGEWLLDDTERGRTVAYKIADGQLPGLSVSFTPGRTLVRNNDKGLPVTVRATVKQVHHVAAVPDPAYMTPEPLMVRQRSPEISSVDRWREWRQSLMVDPK